MYKCFICEAVHQILSAVPKDNPIRSTLEGLDTFENPFVSFNTETRRTRYFNEKWGVFEPVEIMLGHQFDTRRNKQTGTYDQVQVKTLLFTFQF